MRHTVRHSQVWLCRYRIQSTTRHNCLIFPSLEVVLMEQIEEDGLVRVEILQLLRLDVPPTNLLEEGRFCIFILVKGN